MVRREFSCHPGDDSTMASLRSRNLRTLLLSFALSSGLLLGGESASAYLPPIDGWMYRHDGGIADWLGRPYNGKPLHEPINVVLIDTTSHSAIESSLRLFHACRNAGFPSRIGHSGGYLASIEGIQVRQWSPDGRPAFADAPFEESNNHGRIFGPVQWRGNFIFVAAFSREEVDLLAKVKHKYVSFNRARDAFALALTASGSYRLLGWSQLGNAAAADAPFSTGDHDGRAVIVTTTLLAETAGWKLSRTRFGERLF